MQDLVQSSLNVKCNIVEHCRAPPQYKKRGGQVKHCRGEEKHKIAGETELSDNGIADERDVVVHTNSHRHFGTKQFLCLSYAPIPLNLNNLSQLETHFVDEEKWRGLTIGGATCWGKEEENILFSRCLD